MYSLVTVHDTIRVPPNQFGGKLKDAMLKIIRQEYEGLLDEDVGIIVAITDVDNIGEGKVVPGDGAAYYEADITMLVYKPDIHEIVEGSVNEITEFGAFVRTGPVDCLIHVSQIMDDYINYDSKLPGFIGKESGKRLQLNDTVLARVVTLSLKGTIANSKIGLTMRQEGLGKEEWAKMPAKKRGKESSKEQKPAEKTKEKGSEEKK